MFRKTFLAPALFLTFFCFACNKPSDDSVTTRIKAGLYSDPLLKSSSVEVAAKDGVVTLTGQVSDDAARLAAEQIATKTPGVKTVVDRTTMAPAAPETAAIAPEPPPTPAPEHRKRVEKPVRVHHQPAPPPPAASPAPPPQATPASDTATNPGPLNNSAETAAIAKPSAPAPPPPPKPVTVTIPDGTIVSVRTIDSIDSSVNHPGQIFRASLDSPIVVGDHVVVPRGLNVYLKLTDASSAGKFKGRSELTVSLDSFTYQGKTYQVVSSDVQEKGGSRGKRSAAVIGGGAALGALIGGLAGGGKGAAIGAGVGAGSGTAVQALTHGEQVKIPSETRLDFTLRDPVSVTYFRNKSSHAQPAAASADAEQPAPEPPPAASDQPPQH
ncbi:MAG TPA: BON domain-containing protein [Candidatus Eisenbacteria bacterium]|nr:BON domain-containing protein [Candidatus Eisenbacteria bacterium]